MKLITVIGNAALIASVTMFAAGVAHARPNVTAAEAADQTKQLIDVVRKGDALWHGGAPTNPEVKLACGNCHPDAASTGPHTWPKYSLDLGKVAAMRDMINWCVMVVHAAPGMDMNGADMLAMEAYATYMSRGMKLDPGNNAKQMMAVRVIGGEGFPRLENDTEFNGMKNPVYNPKITGSTKAMPSK